MLSNLINNAVDACDAATGVITVDLDLIQDRLWLTISDNGKGMPAEVLQKLRDGIAVTHGKEHGHGIGFGQIRDTITSLNGRLSIASTVGHGSAFTLEFRMNSTIL